LAIKTSIVVGKYRLILIHFNVEIINVLQRKLPTLLNYVVTVPYKNELFCSTALKQSYSNKLFNISIY